MNDPANDMLFSIALASGRYTHRLSLSRHAAQVYSQNGEDGIIAEIFHRVGVQDRTFLEIGVEDGQQNNTRLLLEQGWTGFWLDANAAQLKAACSTFADYIERGRLRVIENVVRTETLNTTLRTAGMPDTIDFLSLDIDQNTSHAWRALQCRTRVACIEYNAALPATAALEVPYDADQQWTSTNWYGASLTTLEEIGLQKDMNLVGCDLHGVNAFFVQSAMVGGRFLSPFTAEMHYEPLRLNAVRRYGHPASIIARSWIGR